MNKLFYLDNIKRLKIIGSICVAYLLSSFALNIFFIQETPSLNPDAFRLLGEKVQTINEQISTMITTSLNKPSTPSDSEITITPPLSSNSSSSSVSESPVVLPSYTPQISPTSFPTIYIPPTNPPKTPTIPPTIYVPPPTQAPQPTSPSTKVTYADFGKCLNSKGMVMYMSATCGLCTQQKKTLKDAANYIRMVDCNANQTNGLECSKVGVRGLPTWGKNGVAVLSGPQSNEALASEAGCQPPSS